jgi:predicted transcriptional regulator
MKKDRKNTRERHGRVLGPLEHEILDVLWTKGEATGKDIYKEIKTTRPIALTTVLTVLERLAGKGLVKKSKGESVFIFTPAYTKDAFAREVSADVLKGIFEISRSGAAASFVDMLASSDPAELDRLSELIESKKRELKKKAV